MTLGAAQDLWACCDIEGHRGKDNRFYLLDFARLFPSACHTGPPGSQLYNLLRPEFVASNQVPLTSDLFVRFATIHPGYPPLALDVCAATNRLIEVEIPRFRALLLTAALPSGWTHSHSQRKLMVLG